MPVVQALNLHQLTRILLSSCYYDKRSGLQAQVSNGYLLFAQLRFGQIKHLTGIDQIRIANLTVVCLIDDCVAIA